MKKYLALLILGAGLVLNSGCYKKARQVAEDDGSGVSSSSRWDWSGTAPLSGIFDNYNIASSNVQIGSKLQVNAVNLQYFSLGEVDSANDISRSITLIVQKDLKSGLHINSSTLNLINFNISYSITDLNNPLNTKYYGTNKIVVKIIKNNEEVIEGYFYGKLQRNTDPSETIEVKNAYFKIDKAGLTIQ